MEFGESGAITSPQTALLPAPPRYHHSVYPSYMIAESYYISLLVVAVTLDATINALVTIPFAEDRAYWKLGERSTTFAQNETWEYFPRVPTGSLRLDSPRLATPEIGRGAEMIWSFVRRERTSRGMGPNGTFPRPDPVPPTAHNRPA